MRKFEWAGIHFGEEETLTLQRSLTVISQDLFLILSSLQKLAHSSKAKTLRLWGKILGSEKDYYVVEADGVEPSGEGGEEDPEQANAEPRGTGVNKFSYFVANDGNLDCHFLNNFLTVSQLLATGLNFLISLPTISLWPERLDISLLVILKPISSPILSSLEKKNTMYKILEKIFLNPISQLKAQIVRISYTTGIAPKGLWKLTEEEDCIYIH